MSQNSVYNLLKRNRGKWFNYKQINHGLKKQGIHVTNSTVTSNVAKLVKWNMIEAGNDRTVRGQHIRKFRIGR